MRRFTRICTTLAAVAAVVTATAGVASAAPPRVTVNVNHSSGVLATSVTGGLSWSTSFRTVTISNVQLFIRDGECARVTAVGFQGSTRVTGTYAFPSATGEICTIGANHTEPLGNISLTASVPGGIDHVIVRLTDVDHEIMRYANCYRTASTCQMG